MSTQSQNSPERQSFFTDEEEVQETRRPGRERRPEKKPPAKNRSHYMKLFFSLLAVTALGFGTKAAYRNSTLFLEDKVQAGYLPVDQYVLYEDGRPVQKVRKLHYTDHYVSTYRDSGLEAPFGIGVGTDWDTFVEAYGDYYFQDLYYMPVDSRGFWDYEDMTFIEGDMKVSDFDRDYVRTGAVDPSRDGINITFSVQYMGNSVIYESDGIYRHLDEYYSFWNELNHSYPRRGELSLRFSFIPGGINDELPDGGLYEIDATNFAY